MFEQYHLLRYAEALGDLNYICVVQSPITCITERKVSLVLRNNNQKLFNNFGDITALTNSEIQEIPNKYIYLHFKLKGRPNRDISNVSLEMLDATWMFLSKKYSKRLNFSV